MSDEYDKKLKFSAALIKNIGLSGFLIVVFVYIFLFVFSKEQQKYFIDSYLLFRNPNHIGLYCSIFILFLFIIIITLAIFYNKDMKVKRSENERLSSEYKRYQELFLNNIKQDL